MAQFTSLQQSQSLTTEMAKLSRSQEIVAANSYIGQQVTVKDGASGSTSGIVSGVKMDADGPQIVVGDKTYPISAVLSVMPGIFSTYSLPPATAGAA
jgi:flagellar hook assembly protein FlgD